MPNDIVKNMRLAQPDFSSLPVGDPGMGAKALDVFFGGPMVRNIMETEPVTEAEPFQITRPTQGSVRGAVRDVGQQALPPVEAGFRQMVGAPAMTPAEQASVKHLGGRAAEVATEFGLYGGVGAGIFGALRSLGTIGKVPLPAGVADDIMPLMGDLDPTVTPRLQAVMDKMTGKQTPVGPTVGPEVQAAAQQATRKLTRVEKMARFNRGLDKIHNHYKNLFKYDKISPAEMANVRTQIDELRQLPKHIAKELRPGIMHSDYWAGLFDPRGKYGGKVTVASHAKDASIVGHEFGHGLMKRLRADVRDRLLKSPMGSAERVSLGKVDNVLSEIRDTTKIGRGQVGRYRAHIEDIRKKGLITEKQYNNAYRRYYDLYHKIPPDEMIVQRFSELITKGVPTKDALKATVKLATKVKDKNLELMKIMGKNLPKLEKGVASQEAVRLMESKVGGAVAELEDTLRYMKKHPKTHTVMAKERMLDNIQQSLMKTPEKYSGQWRAEVGLEQPGGLMKYMDQLQNKSYEEIQKTYRMLKAGEVAPGQAPTGRFVRVGGKMRWHEGHQWPVDAPRPTLADRQVAMKRLAKRNPHIKNYLKSKGVDATPTGMPKSFTRNETGMVHYDNILNKPEYMKKKHGVVGKVVEMSPEEYLTAANKGIGKEAGYKSRFIRQPLVDKYSKMYQKGTEFDMPFLDYSMKSFGQEGRHRMLAAKQAGVSKVRVLVVEDVGATKKPPWTSSQAAAEQRLLKAKDVAESKESYAEQMKKLREWAKKRPYGLSEEQVMGLKNELDLTKHMEDL
ncbi:MAG: hypothetical protein ACW99G_14430 [Candidatus Thorarchaeota archaeon]|jgi:hypothetical protein